LKYFQILIFDFGRHNFVCSKSESVMSPVADHSSDDVKLSAEEARQFEKAFSDDEFRNLMAEYVAELSDPKHKEEQEAYIAQLEAQNELPSGQTLIWPSW
jgi:dynein assembly factor 2